ncbi:MAG: NAD(P)H-nitrite reductase [Chloroflexi bacterium]|nr:NAD(P)H-nitrite reductase [Chloroflexota bacterium]
MWIAGSNRVGSPPDATRAEAALRAAELVVVQDLYHPTDTSWFADVVLPAAGWAEKTEARREAAAVLAFSSAIGAYGAFLVPQSYGWSISGPAARPPRSSGSSPSIASCVGLTWWFYLRPARCGTASALAREAV